MSREIKFRAWNETAKMVEPHMVSLDPTKEKFDSKDLVSEEGWTVMQFTGLHDKNGKEIYEGDVLKCGRYVLGRGPADKGYRNRVVNWSGTRGSWILDDDDGWNASIYSNIEVVGKPFGNR